MTCSNPRMGFLLIFTKYKCLKTCTMINIKPRLCQNVMYIITIMCQSCNRTQLDFLFLLPLPFFLTYHFVINLRNFQGQLSKNNDAQNTSASRCLFSMIEVWKIIYCVQQNVDVDLLKNWKAYVYGIFIKKYIFTLTLIV